MVTKPKSNSVVTHNVESQALGGTIIHFNVLGVGELKLNMENLSAEVKHHAAIHGMIQRISDAAAISRNPETGKPATPAEKFDRMQDLIAHYMSGTSKWSRVGQGSGNRGGYLFRALCILYPSRDQTELRAWLDGKSKSEQSALRNSPKVRAIIDTFVEDSDIDTDAMLGELDS